MSVPSPGRYKATKSSSTTVRCSSPRGGFEMVTALALHLLLLTSTSHALFVPFNASFFPLTATPSPSPSNPAYLKEVVKAIAAKERWDPDGQVRVSEVDAGSARVGGSQVYEFHVRVGRTVLLLRFSDEAIAWRNLGGGEEFGPNLGSGGGAGGRRSAIEDLELEGPLDLHVGSGDDELSLLLPAMNITHEGLRRVLVGDDITVKVQGAQEVSLVHLYGIGLASNGSLGTHNDGRIRFWPLGYPSCAPLPSMHIVGPASLVAYRTRNSGAYIETDFHSYETVDLLPEKCYSSGHSKPVRPSSFRSLHSRLAVVEELLESHLGYQLFQNKSARLLRAKITSSTLVKFRMEVERDVTENDRMWSKAAEWRTKPAVERQTFEVVARVVEGGRVLKPVAVKKPRRPFSVADSTAWSNLMSNISFTQFPSVVVPPEALTLDVKW